MQQKYFELVGILARTSPPENASEKIFFIIYFYQIRETNFVNRIASHVVQKKKIALALQICAHLLRYHLRDTQQRVDGTTVWNRIAKETYERVPALRGLRRACHQFYGDIVIRLVVLELQAVGNARFPHSYAQADESACSYGVRGDELKKFKLYRNRTMVRVA